MFGISLFELLVIMVVMVLFIKPEDIPAIAKSITKAIIKMKRFLANIKEEIAGISKEIGLEDIKRQVEQELAEEQNKTNNKTTIVDIYGQEHQVDNLSELRPDLKKEELEEEIKKHNEINTNSNLN